MIPANELRIGNWVSIGEMCYAPLTKIDPGVSSGFEGIELTPEILLKCGFVHEEKKGIICENYHFYTKEPLAYNSSHAGWWYKSIHWGMPHNLKYLHQLQNLYFALTGTELTILLKKKA